MGITIFKFLFGEVYRRFYATRRAVSPQIEIFDHKTDDIPSQMKILNI